VESNYPHELPPNQNVGYVPHWYLQKVDQETIKKLKGFLQEGYNSISANFWKTGENLLKKSVI
jgi:hypothetical protein